MNKFIVVGLVVVVLAVGFMFLRGQQDAAPAEVPVEPVAVEQAPVAPSTIVDVAVATPDVSTLVTAVVAAELADTLATGGPFTVFAPINSAFEALPAGTLETLLAPEGKADLQNILTYHVVPGVITSADLTDGMTLTTVQGETITVAIGATGVSLNGTANVIAPDVAADNGVIHLIDAVILPPQE